LATKALDKIRYIGYTITVSRGWPSVRQILRKEKGAVDLNLNACILSMHVRSGSAPFVAYSRIAPIS
jgi:hypothetical protein